MTIVSTFGAHDFVDEKVTGRGLKFLRDYLRFAGQVDGSGGSLRDPRTRLSPIESRLAERLREAEVPIILRHGMSRSRIDLAVEHPERPGTPLLAIDTDRDDYHTRGRSIRERDRLRPQQLERMGWRYHRVWTSEWLRDPQAQVEQILEALSAALRSAESIERITGSNNAPRHRESDIPQPTHQARRVLPRPSGIIERLPIEQYPRSVLVGLARWIDSDRMLRDEEEMIDLMKAELGFQRRGKKIVAALQRAVQLARRQERP